MKASSGFLNAQLLLGQFQCIAALLSLHRANDFGFGNFEARLLDFVSGVGRFEMILLGGNAPLGRAMIERGLRLIECRLLSASCRCILEGSRTGSPRFLCRHALPARVTQMMRNSGTLFGATICAETRALSSPRHRTIEADLRDESLPSGTGASCPSNESDRLRKPRRRSRPREAESLQAIVWRGFDVFGDAGAGKKSS